MNVTCNKCNHTFADGETPTRCMSPVELAVGDCPVLNAPAVPVGTEPKGDPQPSDPPPGNDGGPTEQPTRDQGAAPADAQVTAQAPASAGDGLRPTLAEMIEEGSCAVIEGQESVRGVVDVLLRYFPDADRADVEATVSARADALKREAESRTGEVQPLERLDIIDHGVHPGDAADHGGLVQVTVKGNGEDSHVHVDMGSHFLKIARGIPQMVRADVAVILKRLHLTA